MSDGNGNTVLMPTATSDHAVERIMRAALSAMGSAVAVAEPPVTGAETKRWVVEHTISQSWRIGRAVVRARRENRLDDVAEMILDECGGRDAGRVLVRRGKIVGVERTLRNGHVYGECIVEDLDDDDGDDQEGRSRVKIPFKNENIAAIRLAGAKEEDGEGELLGVVPDLITLLDTQNGEAIGTPEYRYGLLVTVLGITASDKWTSTERGLELGGPRGFDMGHLTYTPLGRFVKPVSVIDEYDG
jgi:DUF917 family protein